MLRNLKGLGIVMALTVWTAYAMAAPAHRYQPPSNSFSCDVPDGWTASEEDTPDGSLVVHIMGPDDPTGVYRTGIDVHYNEKGSLGFIPYKTAIDRMRSAERTTNRQAVGSVRLLRTPTGMARLFEITETVRLPFEQLPAANVVLHQYVAIMPVADSYFIIRLSSTQEVYVDYRDEFTSFLKSFRPSGVMR